MAALPLAVPKLDAKSVTVKLFADDPFQTALATIARDAIDLLGSPLRTRIKACEQPDCRMLFLDTSRRSEEHTSELQSLMRISYAVFCLQKKNTQTKHIK